VQRNQDVSRGTYHERYKEIEVFHLELATKRCKEIRMFPVELATKDTKRL